MNGNNAFVKSWDFINVIVQYVFARYGESGGKMAESFSKVEGGIEWNAREFFAGLGEMAYLTGIILFFLYLLFHGFRQHSGAHCAALVLLIALAVVSCIG